MKSSIETLIAALRILARDIQSEDGIANAAIEEAADRLTELERENAALKLQIPALAAANDKLFMENLYLGKDKQRLDWLAVTDVWFDEPATESYTPETFRAEIDRKRKEAQP